MATVIDLGQKIKAKYPEYSDISDLDLGRRVKAKYPEYSDFMDIPEKLLEQSSFFKILGQRTGEFGIGALKGLGQTLAAASQLGERMLQTPLRVLGQPIEEKTAIEQLIPSGFFETRTPVETAGKTAERIGEFFVPGAALGKAAKTTGILGRAGLEAAGTGTIAALQDAGKEEIALIAGISGAIPITGKILGPIKPFLTERVPTKLINSIIKPISKHFDFRKNPGEGIVEEGIIANTRQGLLNKITSKKEEIGTEIEKILKKYPEERIDVSKLLNPIDEALKIAVEGGEQGLVTRLIGIREGITKEFKLIDGELVSQRLKNLILSPKDAQLLKRKIGDSARWTGQAFDNDVNQIKVKIYRNIDRAIDKAAPGIEKLNDRYANILTAENALGRTITIAERQNIIGLPPLIAGGGLGLLTNDIIKGIGAGLLYKAMATPAIRTRIAQTLNKLKDVKLEAKINALKNIIAGTAAD